MGPPTHGAAALFVTAVSVAFLTKSNCPQRQGALAIFAKHLPTQRLSYCTGSVAVAQRWVCALLMFCYHNILTKGIPSSASLPLGVLRWLPLLVVWAWLGLLAQTLLHLHICFWLQN